MPAKALAAPRQRKTAAISTPSRRVVRFPDAIWLVVLVVLSVAVFAPVRHFSFVSWDEPFYITENPIVQQGLTFHGVSWAFTVAARD
jgi:hypothetical protein